MGIPKLSEVGQSDLHMHVVEGMPLNKKQKLVFSIIFVDKNGNKVADTAEEAFANMTQKQRNIHKALLMEIKTGKPYRPL